VDINTSLICHEEADKQGAYFLDAPISGGVTGATAATLSIMVGGKKEAFDRCTPVFQAMGKTILHMGKASTGTISKLVNQLLVCIHTAASCEAIELAKKSDVDIQKLLQLLMNSYGASKMLERNTPMIMNKQFENTGAPIRLIAKDIGIISDLGRELNLNLSTTFEVEKIIKKAVQDGYGESDFSTISKYVDMDKNKEKN